jgi:hypothetical protein
MMHTPSLYLDTSVLGGYYDEEWKQPTQELWRQKEAGQWLFLSSDVTTGEIEGAPDRVRHLFVQTFSPHMLIETTEEMDDLAAPYVAHGVVSPKYEDDALFVPLQGSTFS